MSASNQGQTRNVLTKTTSIWRTPDFKNMLYDGAEKQAFGA